MLVDKVVVVLVVVVVVARDENREWVLLDTTTHTCTRAYQHGRLSGAF